MTADRLCYDAAYPVPHGIGGTDTVLLYCGGDTPHIWTDAEIAAQPERFRLPCYVRSNTGGTAAQDATNMLAWLYIHSVPKGSATVIDLETLVAPAYVAAYGATLNAAGYGVLPYGSGGTLFKNPRLDGYFLAEPSATGIDPRTVATQFAYYGGYDLSWILPTVPLWDTTPPPAPAPPVITHYPGDNVNQSTITFAIAGGNGWAPSPVPAAKIVSVNPFDENPEAVGRYDNVPLYRGLATQPSKDAPNGVIVFSGGADGVFGATVWSEP